MMNLFNSMSVYYKLFKLLIILCTVQRMMSLSPDLKDPSLIPINNQDLYVLWKKLTKIAGSGCGSVGRAVASDSKIYFNILKERQLLVQLPTASSGLWYYHSKLFYDSKLNTECILRPINLCQFYCNKTHKASQTW